jgi:hypothetical protein
MDLDPDSAIFVIELQDANKKIFALKGYAYFLKVHLHRFTKTKSPKEVTKRVGIKVSYYFYLLIE